MTEMERKEGTYEEPVVSEKKMTVGEQYALLTEGNKQIVNRQIEKLIEMQSADQQ